MATARSCVVLLSHRLCDATLPRLDSLRDGLAGRMDIVLALTEPLGRAAAACGIVEALVFGRDDLYLPAYGAKAASRRILPGNPDLVLLAVRRARPDHARYWYIEFDVWFPGGAGVLAELDPRSEADLVVPLRAHPRSSSPKWHHWPSLRIPPAEAMAEEAQHHTLLCLHRASGRLLDAADAAYRRGWAGHFEATLPSIAVASGFTIERLNEIARAHRGAPVIDARGFRSNGCEMAEPGLIYHPVKTAAAEDDLRAGRSVSKKG